MLQVFPNPFCTVVAEQQSNRAADKWKVGHSEWLHAPVGKRRGTVTLRPTINRKHKVTRQALCISPLVFGLIMSWHWLTRVPAPSLVTEMKSEAAVGAYQRSAPHSSPGVLGLRQHWRRQAGTRSVQFRVTLVFSEGEIKFKIKSASLKYLKAENSRNLLMA